MKNVHWIQGGNQCESPLFRRSFLLQQVSQSAKIDICGLGYFQLFVNGKRVGDQEFMPAMTNYTSLLGCETTYPVWEERRAYRCLYMTFDLMPFLKLGENVIGIQLGNGWYHQTQRIDEGKMIFGFPKLRYEVTISQANGEEIFLESNSQTMWKPSEVIKNNLFCGETHDLRLLQDNWCTNSADLSDWEPAHPVHAPEAELTPQECPPDQVQRRISPTLLETYGNKKLYDCQENIAGWVQIRCIGEKDEQVFIRHSEELSADKKSLDFESAGGDRQIQEDCYICNGSSIVVQPKFCWHGFRYFEVEGPGEVICAEVVCTNTPVISSFKCSDPILNWLYDAYIRTQINNFHNCIPSDCPHRERLGYTGDGQLTAETAMLLLDCKKLYEKWYQDILDSQGIDTGHIPHTAPFLGGGGGPGGWGCAVYVIPMNYYKVYGDIGLLEKGYPAIIRWLNYMEQHCKEHLVVGEETGGWCLGEWCAPASETETLPEAFVNTYYYIQGLEALKHMAEILHKTEPTWVEERIRLSKKAFEHTYFNVETDDFCNGIGGANGFALNLGLGTFGTKQNLVTRYKRLARLDTGIFGTPVLIQQLFCQGEGNLAIELLTNDSEISFAHMMKNGATTLWEKWEGTESHNHPMFGSVVKFLFTEILGIRQKKDTSGFEDYEIQPADIGAITWAKGTILTRAGTISVKWERDISGAIKMEV